jgi:pimeloyl-ACP methyl ester carboxylesterase
MDIILIPGFWLDGSSWDAVADPLRAAGHEVEALTLPGLESRDANRATINLDDHIRAVVNAIDERATDASGEPVVLVGHSGGGPIAWGAIDQRADRVARAIYVDSGPLTSGSSIGGPDTDLATEFPLPEWTAFDEANLRDLSDDLRDQFRARSIPEPGRVNTDTFSLNDPRRYNVPSTVIACSYPTEMLREWMKTGHPYMAELAHVKRVEFVDLPTGHWPQFTKPAELAAIIAAAVK